MESYWEGYPDMNKKKDKEFKMIQEIVDHEIDMMDLDGLYEYATDQLWKYFDGKSFEEIEELYKEYLSEETYD